jgi:hypothetical protein
MILYAVFREGVQRHECGGIFDTLDAAKVAVRALIAEEDDDYHYYTVTPFTLNQQAEMTGEGMGRTPVEPDIVYSAARRKGKLDES